jgi:hypothetical protein
MRANGHLNQMTTVSCSSCYAIIIKKKVKFSLLTKMEIYLPKFTHGQIYIALLRATSKEHFMFITRDNERNPCEYANNVMFKDVFGAIKIGLYII